MFGQKIYWRLLILGMYTGMIKFEKGINGAGAKEFSFPVSGYWLGRLLLLITLSEMQLKVV